MRIDITTTGVRTRACCTVSEVIIQWRNQRKGGGVLSGCDRASVLSCIFKSDFVSIRISKVVIHFFGLHPICYPLSRIEFKKITMYFDVRKVMFNFHSTLLKMHNYVLLRDKNANLGLFSKILRFSTLRFQTRSI